MPVTTYIIFNLEGHLQSYQQTHDRWDPSALMLLLDNYWTCGFLVPEQHKSDVESDENDSAKNIVNYNNFHTTNLASIPTQLLRQYDKLFD